MGHLLAVVLVRVLVLERFPCLCQRFQDGSSTSTAALKYAYEYAKDPFHGVSGSTYMSACLCLRYQDKRHKGIVKGLGNTALTKECRRNGIGFNSNRHTGSELLSDFLPIWIPLFPVPPPSGRLSRRPSPATGADASLAYLNLLICIL